MRHHNRNFCLVRKCQSGRKIFKKYSSSPLKFWRNPEIMTFENVKKHVKNTRKFQKKSRNNSKTWEKNSEVPKKISKKFKKTFAILKILLVRKKSR